MPIFSAKISDKLPSTAREITRNRLRLNILSEINPFVKKSDGTMKYPQFEDVVKVIRSLRVVDDDGKLLAGRTPDLQKDVIKMSRQDTYLELVYNVEEPTETQFLDTLEEKLVVNLANLVLDPQISAKRSLTPAEISRIKKAFTRMLARA